MEHTLRTQPDNRPSRFRVRSPQLAGRLLVLALETLSELATVSHRAQNTGPLRCMRVSVDPVDSVLLARLATPPVGVRDKEKLVLCEVFKTRKILIGLLVGTKLPSLVRGRQAASVSDVLAQSETSIDVERLVVGAGYREVGVLLDKALSALLEGVNGSVRPPVCVIAILVIVATCRIESVTELMSSNGAERTV